MRLISAATVLESRIVLEARSDEAGRDLDRLLLRAKLKIVPVDNGHVEIARAAYRKYGKGRHRAALNFGDCFPYALAKSAGEPLLFKGDDFARTDIIPAVRTQ